MPFTEVGAGFGLTKKCVIWAANHQIRGSEPLTDVHGHVRTEYGKVGSTHEGCESDNQI